MDNTLADLLRRLYGLGGQYIRDVLPGGSLNPEWTPERVRAAAEVGSMEPGILGSTLSGLLAVDDLRQGNYGDAALNAVGLLPFVPGMAGAIKYHGTKTKEPFDFLKTKSESVNSTTLGDVTTSRHAAFVTDKPKFAEEFGEVTKWDVKPKKTAIIDDNLKYKFLDSLDPFGPNRDIYMQAKYSKQPWGMFDGELGKVFTEWLKKEGYDSAKFKEYIPTKNGKEIGGTTTAILDSAIANRILP